MKTKIAVILDRSGSMESRKSDHEGGLKSFIEDQKKLDGEVDFTFVQFDSHNPCEVVYDDVPIDEVNEINLVPRGGTPLLDAVGKTLAHLTKKYKGQAYDDVFVMIITDGEENQSTEWTLETLKTAVENKKKENWQFLFLGAGLDDFAGTSYTGTTTRSASFVNSASGCQVAYDLTSSKFKYYRTSRAGGQSIQNCSTVMDFSDEDRDILKKG